MTMRVTRALFAIVAVVAGPVGVIMLIAPDETDRYFSWPIGPPPVAATVGGFYVASAIVFGWAALRADWAEMRPLCLGVLALTIPTLVATLYHEEVFDFGRGQAMAWVGLFAAAPIAYGALLYLWRGRVTPDVETLGSPVQGAAGGLALIYFGRAVVYGFDPTGSGNDGIPFAAPGMSGRFLGCWAAFLSVLALFVVVRNRWREVRVALVALTLWPFSALLAALRTFDDFDDGAGRIWYPFVLAILVALPALLLFEGRKRFSASDPSP